MSDLINSVLAQYEKNKNAASGIGKISQEERMKKYFNTILPKGTRNGEKRVRILPTKDGSSPFIEVYFHELQVDGKWVKIYDPAQVGDRSPLNEVREALLETGKESDKEIAKSYRSRKFYIVKVVDRDNEQDGVKFWRFKDSYKNEGILDKIFPIFKSRGDITDPKTGRDLTLSLALTKSGNNREYTVINSILPEDPSPLHENAEITSEWVEDTLTWKDAYSMKPVEWLEMVAKGETPKWNNDTKKWVSSSVEDEEIAGTGSSTADDEDDVDATNVPDDPQDEDESNDDLPF